MPSARPLKIRAVSLYPYWSKPAADTAVAPRRSIETIPPASHALFDVRLIIDTFLIIIVIVLHFPMHVQTRHHARKTSPFHITSGAKFRAVYCCGAQYVSPAATTFKLGSVSTTKRYQVIWCFYPSTGWSVRHPGISVSVYKPWSPTYSSHD